ncbi:para-aminobenzoate synthase, aminase component [Hydrogenimonas sp.]|nr:para-aminobenzoate synthase, aminase component [Hydrogenimonas sp.]
MDRLSALAKEGRPFLFVISYDKSEIFAEPLDELPPDILVSHRRPPSALHPAPTLLKHPVPFGRYADAFERVIEQIEAGNTYLLNLTFSTPVEIGLTLREIYERANAPFKLLFKNRFVCFSPEPFVTIENGTISTFPMKGTIDEALPGAAEKIMADEKEMAEHVMVVDLLRNDLGMVAEKVRVKRFRYIDKIVTADKTLLQVSSHIEAKLDEEWPSRLGEIMDALLPAGSITGTPKKRTCEIIESVESHERGFFTGVFGVCDGKRLWSAVMIRFIERTPGGLVYKSGGGITIDSDPQSEYREMIDKVYFPL